MDGLEQGTEFGPINNKRQYEKVLDLLADARINGTVMPNKAVDRARGFFIHPTIVRDVAEGSRIVREEQFGPVLPVLKFIHDGDALARANNTPFGLGGSVWSSNPNRAYALADQMEAGMVWINRHGGAGITFRSSGPSSPALVQNWGEPRRSMSIHNSRSSTSSIKRGRSCGTAGPLRRRGSVFHGSI